MFLPIQKLSDNPPTRVGQKVSEFSATIPKGSASQKKSLGYPEYAGFNFIWAWDLHCGNCRCTDDLHSVISPKVRGVLQRVCRSHL